MLFTKRTVWQSGRKPKAKEHAESYRVIARTCWRNWARRLVAPSLISTDDTFLMALLGLETDCRCFRSSSWLLFNVGSHALNTSSEWKKSRFIESGLDAETG